MSELVGNPEDRFSCVTAQMSCIVKTVIKAYFGIGSKQISKLTI